MRSNPREYFNLVPPTVQTDAGVDGQRVTLNRWQALVVRLDEDPSYGQRWEMQPIASSTVIAPVQHDLLREGGHRSRVAEHSRPRGLPLARCRSRHATGRARVQASVRNGRLEDDPLRRRRPLARSRRAMQSDADARVARRLAARFAPECWIVLCVRVVSAATHETADAVTSTPDHYLAAAWTPPVSGPARWPEAVVIGSPTATRALDALLRHLPAEASLYLAALDDVDAALAAEHPARGRPQSRAVPTRGHRSVRPQRARPGARSGSPRATPTRSRLRAVSRGCARGPRLIRGGGLADPRRRFHERTATREADHRRGGRVRRWRTARRAGRPDRGLRRFRAPAARAGTVGRRLRLPVRSAARARRRARLAAALAGAGQPLREARSRDDRGGVRCVPCGTAGRKQVRAPGERRRVGRAFVDEARESAGRVDAARRRAATARCGRPPSRAA